MNIKKGIMSLDVLKSKTAFNVYFALAFVLLFFYYGLNETLFSPPQSVHIWRQTNSLSLTLNYYQYDLPFLEPEMHNQFGGGGYSGKAGGEFPIIYYLVAKLWDVFGAHEWIFKLIQIIIFFSGLFALFHSLKYILKNQFMAAFVSLLVFTSPMIVFYGPNYLPDVPSLSFVFIAWYFLFQYLKKRKTLNLWFSALMFSLAMLLKITAAISFIALGGWILIEMFFMKKDQCIFCFKLKDIIPFILAIGPVVLWYVYIEHYNQINQGLYSYQGILPLWDMTKEQIQKVIESLHLIYFKEMYLPYTQYVTLGIWLFLIFRIRKLKPVLRYFMIVLPIGMAIQIVLWFQVFEAHDYYMVNLIVVLVAVWSIFLAQLTNLRTPIKVAISILIIVFFTWNAVECHERIENRYVGWMNEMYPRIKALKEIESSFQEWGVQPDDKVISLPDFTFNGSLYYMNRKGYTEYGSNMTSKEGFYLRIEQGARYLVVNDSTILNNDYIKPFTQNKIGQFKNISVFDLRNIKPD